MDATIHNTAGEPITIRLPGPGDQVRIRGFRHVLTVTSVELNGPALEIVGTYPRPLGRTGVTLTEGYTACVLADEYTIASTTEGGQ